MDYFPFYVFEENGILESVYDNDQRTILLSPFSLRGLIPGVGFNSPDACIDSDNHLNKIMFSEAYLVCLHRGR